MRCGVVGGSGFLGRQLVAELLSHGHTVVNGDVRPFPDRWLQNIDECKRSKLTHTHLDICAKTEVTKFLSIPLDAVFWLACCIDWRPLPVSEHTWQCNVESVAHAMAVLRDREDPPVIVYVCTLEVCTGCEGDLNTARVDVNSLSDSYTYTKALAEQAVLSANTALRPDGTTSKLRSVSIRPVHIYGPGDVLLTNTAPYGVVPRTFSKQEYEFISIENTALALRLAGEKLSAESEEIAGHSFLITEGFRVDMCEFINRVREGSQAALIPVPVPNCVLMLVGEIGETIYALTRLVSRCDTYISHHPPPPSTSPLPIRLFEICAALVMFFLRLFTMVFFGHPSHAIDRPIHLTTRFELANFTLSFRGDHSKATRMFGYRPQYRSEDCTARVREWYKWTYGGGTGASANHTTHKKMDKGQ